VVAKKTRPPGRREVAHQHGGAPLDDAALRRLVQEAVDEALKQIAREEGHVEALASQVAAREGERKAAPPGDIGALEARLLAVEGRLRNIDDRHGRVEARVEDLTLHVGHREPLEVSKVPPDILERSFQAALDELTGELSKVRGSDEVERILDEAIEDVRGQSKGSELFERAPGRIVIRGLGAAVSKKLLSHKAALSTFDEVVKDLRQHLPSYRPRTLAALVRVRSADYAVEAALAHQRRLTDAERSLEALIKETRRIEADAKVADEEAARGAFQSLSEATSERRQVSQDFQGRIKALEKRAVDAEASLERSLGRLDAVERYSQRVEAAMIRRTKDGTFKGDFTPVIEAVHEALKDGKPRTLRQVGRRVKGVEFEVVEAVVREGIREGDFEESEGGKVSKRR
jgi:hypothetical protein